MGRGTLEESTAEGPFPRLVGEALGFLGRLSLVPESSSFFRHATEGEERLPRLKECMVPSPASWSRSRWSGEGPCSVIYDIIVPAPLPAPCHFTVARRSWLALSSGVLLPSQGRPYSESHQGLLHTSLSCSVSLGGTA